MSTAITSLYWVIGFLSWAYALRNGGWLAAWAFILFLGAMAGTSFSAPASSAKDLWVGVNWPLFVTDTVYFIGLLFLMLFSRRYWPIWAAGFQLACVLSHVPSMLDPGINPRLYRMLESVWMLPMLVTMVAGIMQDRWHDRREARRSEDRSAT